MLEDTNSLDGAHFTYKLARGWVVTARQECMMLLFICVCCKKALYVYIFIFIKIYSSITLIQEMWDIVFIDGYIYIRAAA